MMSETWQVKKTGPGLAIEDMIARMLGPEFAVDEFDPARALAHQVDQAHVLLVRSTPVTREVIDAAPCLRLIQRPGVHLEVVDVEYATARGIPVCNVPASLTHGGEDVAEHAMFLALALAKRYREGLASLSACRIGEPSTHVLRGKVLGLVGLGRTGWRHGVIPARLFSGFQRRHCHGDDDFPRLHHDRVGEYWGLA